MIRFCVSSDVISGFRDCIFYTDVLTADIQSKHGYTMDVVVNVGERWPGLLVAVFAALYKSHDDM